MTASKTAKAAGLDSLKELAGMCKKPTQTLDNWYKNSPELFDLVVAGAVVLKKRDMVYAFNTLGEPSVLVEVSDLFVTVNGLAYTHEAFLTGAINFTAADSQRVHKAIRKFDVFTGDL